jgi:hypothetical protein
MYRLSSSKFQDLYVLYGKRVAFVKSMAIMILESSEHPLVPLTALPPIYICRGSGDGYGSDTITRRSASAQDLWLRPCHHSLNPGVKASWAITKRRGGGICAPGGRKVPVRVYFHACKAFFPSIFGAAKQRECV